MKRNKAVTVESSTADGTNGGPIQLLQKADLILDVLGEHGARTPAEIATAIGEPRSSVYRLLHSLAVLGWVETESDSGAYRLGIRMFRLGRAAVSRLDPRDQALPVMRRLHDATGETVYLCIRQRFEAVCIDRIDGRRVQILALTLGGSLPLHAGAAPRVLLAYADEEVARAWAALADRGELARYTPKTPVSRDEIEPILAQIRRTGVSVSDEDVTPGIAAVGVPIFDHDGDCVAALSVAGIRGGVLGPDADLTNDAVAAGAEISHALGHSGGVSRTQRKI
jgi:DNA-binding IclR family transcriptional regulator